MKTSAKTDLNLKTFIGRGSGVGAAGFSGRGWVLIQPSEGRVTSAAAGGQASSSSAGGALGKLLSG